MSSVLLQSKSSVGHQEAESASRRMLLRCIVHNHSLSREICMTAKTIDEYIAAFPHHIQQRLQCMRTIVHTNAPQAVEAMAYGIPTFRLNGNLVHFGAFKAHIGFYPAPPALTAFKKELAGYHSTKGAVHFLLTQPLPTELIAEIVRFRVNQNLNGQKNPPA
jgi:uncharacterized protein YdhG (YjbR/CyaY superfamily)